MARFVDCLQSYRFLQENNLDYKKIPNFGSTFHQERLRLTKLLAKDPSNPIIAKHDNELLEFFKDPETFELMVSDTPVDFSWIENHENSILKTINTKRRKAEEKGQQYVAPIPLGSKPETNIPDPQPITEPTKEAQTTHVDTNEHVGDNNEPQVPVTPPVTPVSAPPVDNTPKPPLNTNKSQPKPRDCNFDVSELSNDDKVLVSIMQHVNSPIWQMLYEELDECDFNVSLIKGSNFRTEYFDFSKPFGNQYYTIRLIKPLKIIE